MRALPMILGGSTALLAGSAAYGMLSNTESPSLSQVAGFGGVMGLAMGTGTALESVRIGRSVGVAEARLGRGYLGITTGLALGAIVGGALGIAHNRD